MPTYLAADLVEVPHNIDNQGHYVIFQTTSVSTMPTKLISFTYLFQNVEMK